MSSARAIRVTVRRQSSGSSPTAHKASRWVERMGSSRTSRPSSVHGSSLAIASIPLPSVWRRPPWFHASAEAIHTPPPGECEELVAAEREEQETGEELQADQPHWRSLS